MDFFARPSFVGSLFSATKQKRLLCLFRSFRFKISPSGLLEFVKFPLFRSNSENDTSNILHNCRLTASSLAQIIDGYWPFLKKNQPIAYRPLDVLSIHALAGGVFFGLLVDSGAFSHGGGR